MQEIKQNVLTKYYIGSIIHLCLYRGVEQLAARRAHKPSQVKNQLQVKVIENTKKH